MRTGTIRIVAGGAGKSVPPVLYHIGKTPMNGDAANPWLGVGIGCAEAGESRGVVRVRGGVTPFGKADRKGGFRGVFGILQKSLRCRAAMSEMTLLRGRNDVGKRGL